MRWAGLILVTCATGSAAAPSAGLVAAYSFNEGVGSLAADLSGRGNTGSVSGASWTPQGRFGSALEFDGTSDWVTVADSPSLRLTSALTIEAWVFPAALPTTWTDVVFKWNDDWFLMATSPPSARPAAGSRSFTSHLLGTSSLPLVTWSHLAATYDGATARLYVNGIQVSSASQTALLATSGGPLSIGGDALFGQYFSGRIDEVRVYDRALAVAEIQSDMTTPITSQSDTTPPTVSIVPLSSTRVGGVVQVEISANDDIGVRSVELHLDGLLQGSDLSPPYLVNWNTTTTTNGAHTLTAVAHDLAGNQGTSAPVAVTIQNPAFSNEVVVPGITAATTLVFLPDGRLLVGELTETIWVVPPGATTPDPTPFLQLDSNGLFGEQGLMDITLDPDFATNSYYYVFYTHASTSEGNRDRVSRFTANGNATVPGSEVVLWQDAVPADAEHHGGAIVFGPDGKLYITVGDHFNAPDAQRLDSYHGKILRINRDGAIPTDNPFFDGPGPNRDAIWALGLRNPFRACFDPGSGRLFIGDVGGNDASVAQEEVNLGAAGANYGWPLCEGNCGIAGTTSPLYSYPHLGRDASITGGFVYRGGQFPSDYQGSYFFADYAQNWIKRLTFDAAGNLRGVVEFEPPDGATDGPIGDPVKLVQGPDGALYYVDIGFNGQHVPNEAAIRRIRHVDDDLPPVATASANPTSGLAPLVVAFSSAGSFDPEGVPLTYSWDFGDNSSSTAPNPTHTYTANGMYTVRLTVSDGRNPTLASDVVITVGVPPSVEILTPVDGSRFQAGDVIGFSGRAFDAAGTPLPASAFAWTIVFHHDSHVHPGGGFPNTTSGAFAIPTSGHDFAGSTSYEFVLTVVDAEGLTAVASVSVYPDKVNLLFETVPPGLSLEVDGVRRVTPFIRDTLKGFHHTIHAPAQFLGNISYDFVSWSDGGAQSHDIVVPPSPATWVATFVPAPGATGLMAAYSFDEGSGTAVADASGFDNTGTLTGATWTPQGRFGNALDFDGVSALVSVPDSPSLRLTSAMTLEAWVAPTVLASDWEDVVYKWNDDWYLMAASPPSARPVLGSQSFTGDLAGPTALSFNTWAYLAATYDGATTHLYVNGVEVNSGAQTSPLPTSGGPLSIGGDALFGQYFSGRIDEVRIYNRALSPTEIQRDMTTPISIPVDAGTIPSVGRSALVAALPNPFNSATTIRFRLASSGDAILRIYNVAGHLVRSIGLQQLTPGTHEVNWKGVDNAGKPVASGAYWVHLDAGDAKDTMRITLLK